MKRAVLGIFAAAVLLILFVVLCTFVRRPYEKVLIDRFGNLIEVPDKGTIAYNWYFKFPTDTVVRADTRLHVLTLPLKEYVTANREPIMVRAYVVWRINDAMKFRKKASASDDVAEQMMTQRIAGLIGQDFGRHALDEFFNSTDPKTDEKIRAIETTIAAEATNGTADKQSPGLTEMGIEIADIGFSRVAFPVANTDAVYQRMVAELNEKARFYQSSGRKEADILLAEGDRKAKETVSTALAEAGNIRGAGDREAGEIIAKVSNTDAAMDFYQYWKSLDVLKASLAKNTILVLSTESPFVKNLFDALKNLPAGTGAQANQAPAAPANPAAPALTPTPATTLPSAAIGR